jgi:hypothetical protein
MFRLEEFRPGAEIRLALALLRAWMEAGHKAPRENHREWLNQISPICLQMIEKAADRNGIAGPSA